MQEQITEVLSYLKGLLKYKWVGVVFAWIVCLCGWLFVSALPNKYTSEAKVHVETRTMLQPLMKGMTVQSDVRGLLRVMQLLMFTKTNLEQIIKLSDLNKGLKTPADQLELIESLKKQIQINGGNDEIFVIKYESESPETAKNVVQAVLTVFSEQTQQSTLAGADSAHRFIDEQIREYEIRLRNQEKARENFKRANLGLLLSKDNDQIGQIQQMTATLEEAKLGLKEATSKRDVLKKQLDEALASVDNEWGAITGTQTSNEDPKIAELNQKKDELLLKYTKNHPEITHIEKTIKDLIDINAKKQAKLLEAGGLDAAVMTNPYAQTIKVQLNEAEGEIASINSRVEILEKRLQTAKDELNTRLSVETEIQNLNRDYESIKSSYEQLLESREQASMSKKVDDQAEALKFKIADAPNKPLEPSSPNRKLLFSIVLVAGIIFGAGISFLLYLMRPTIMSISQLRHVTGLPVLGGVSLKISAEQAEKNKKEAIRYSFASFGLVAVYIAFMVVDILGIKLLNLSLLLQRIH